MKKPVKSHRRRRSPRRHYRRHQYRRSPSLMGFTFPDMTDVLAVGAGFVVPPLLTTYVMQYLPASITSSKIGYYAVKAATAIVPPLIVKRFVSPRIGNMMLVGGIASVVVDIVKDSGILSSLGIGHWQPMLGYYPPRGLGAYGPARVPAAGKAMLPAMIATTPDRLSPAGRF